MARLRPTAKDLQIKKLAQEAASTLRAQGADEQAGAIDYLLSPAGWATLGRLRSAEGGSNWAETRTNLSVRLPQVLRDRINQLAEARGDNLSEKVDEGFAAFVAGEFTPERPRRLPYGSGVWMANLGVRVDQGLRDRVKEVAQERTEMLGWTPELGHVAAQWLMRQYEVSFEMPEPKKRGVQRVTPVPRPVREQIRARAKELGRTVEDVVNEGFQRYLDGDLELPQPAWLDVRDMVQLKMYPDTELYQKVKERGGMSPVKLAVAYLLDEFGIEA